MRNLKTIENRVLAVLTVGYHIRNLRRKLVSSHINIESVREVGYRMR